MIIITTGTNNIEFNASAEIAYSSYIMEIVGLSATYSQDVTLNAPTIQNDRYMRFVVTQVASPDTSNAEFYLPNAGEYYCIIYNTDSDKDSGDVIYRGILVLHLSPATNKVYVSSKTRKVW